MAIHRLERAQWQPFFDYISPLLHDDQAEVGAAGLRLNGHREHEWARLNGLYYHPQDDVLEVITDGGGHRIPHPKDIYVDDSGSTLRALDVIDAEGNHRLVQLRDPVPLAIPQ
jgi:hypothetical protein